MCDWRSTPRVTCGAITSRLKPPRAILWIVTVLYLTNHRHFSGNVYIRFYGTLLGDDTDIIGKKFLAQDIFKELDTFINAISDKVFSLSQLIKNEDQDYELYLKDGGKIIFSLEDGVGKSLSNLFSALETDPLKTNLSNKPKELEYIDLRFGNKVFLSLSKNTHTNEKPLNV